MRRFVLGWRALGHERRLDAHIVNYADDFVICCRGTAEQAMAAMRDMMTRLKLMVNESKTHTCQVPQQTFDFLGYTFGRNYSPRTGRSHIGTRPSGKRVVRLCRTISEMTGRDRTLQSAEELVGKLNPVLIGWANYFCLGPVSKAYRAVDQHTCRRLRQWLCVKHRVRASGFYRFPDRWLREQLGLVYLPRLTQSFPWANA